MFSGQGLPVFKMWSLFWGFWKSVKELASIGNLLRALCQCSLYLLENPSLAYIILASSASTVMNHYEKPDTLADRTSTENHMEEIRGINTLHSFLGQSFSTAMLPTFQGAKKSGAHFYLVLSICCHGWKSFCIYDIKWRCAFEHFVLSECAFRRHV